MIRVKVIWHPLAHMGDEYKGKEKATEQDLILFGLDNKYPELEYDGPVSL
jgi:hypothetical protein